MTENLSITHQKVKKNYLTLFTDYSVSSKKNGARTILESILNYLLLEHLNIDIEEITENKQKKNIDVPKRIDLLIKSKRINKNLKPGLLFVSKEGNMGSHSNRRPDDAGEASYVDAMIICLKPLIKNFFTAYDYDISFLNIHKSIENKTLEDKNQQLIIEKQELEQELGFLSKKEIEFSKKITSEKNLVLRLKSKNKSILAEKRRAEKKNKPFIIASSIIGLLFVFSMIYLFSIQKDLNLKDKNIDSLTTSQKQINERLKRKNYTIDSLKRVVLITESKQETNNGFKNEFKGNVGKVENHQNINSLEDLDKK